jgi:hypothetical protein
VDVATEASIQADEMPQIFRRFRLQFEPAQSAWVLLYPEGMVRLSPSAGTPAFSIVVTTARESHREG